MAPEAGQREHGILGPAVPACLHLMEKPFAPSCERNREPILAVLREHFADRHNVLEIGSGTGQHAVHFAAAMPWLDWQCSDRAEALPGMRQWLDEAGLPNTPPPVELDVATDWSTLTPTLSRRWERGQIGRASCRERV